MFLQVVSARMNGIIYKVTESNAFSMEAEAIFHLNFRSPLHAFPFYIDRSTFSCFRFDKKKTDVVLPFNSRKPPTRLGPQGRTRVRAGSVAASIRRVCSRSH